jgi:D-sedoheptulose 7-phosphate isomerase
MNRLDKLFSDGPDEESFARGYLDYLKEVLSGLDPSKIAALINIVLNARARGAQIFFAGNGGSASTASHFVNDLVIGTRASGKPFRAFSLCENMSTVTAIANDHGYDRIFTKQLEQLMKRGDVLVAISASGNSPNVVEAVNYANEQGGVTVALTGFDGGKLKTIAGLVVHVPTNQGEYGPTEDIHLVIDHLVSAFLAYACREDAIS